MYATDLQFLEEEEGKHTQNTQKINKHIQSKVNTKDIHKTIQSNKIKNHIKFINFILTDTVSSYFNTTEKMAK